MVLTLLLVMLLDTAGTLIGVARQAGCSIKTDACRGSAKRCSRFQWGHARRRTWHLDDHRLYRKRGRRRGGRPHRPHRARGVGAVSGEPVPGAARPDRSYATAPALLFVACLMAASLGAIQWDEPTEYIPALTIALMIPLSYSIATGIGLGFIAYVALKLLSGRVREINAASGTIAGAFLLKLIFA
jgi:AGZA family xanthine/uracil permease-like MFS transporter